MATYKTKIETKVFSKPGLDPTTKNGNQVGVLLAGATFDSTKLICGWLAVWDAANRWVKLLDCDAVETPPPPPPQEVIVRISESYDGGLTYPVNRYFREIQQ